MAQNAAIGQGQNFPTRVGGYLPYSIFSNSVQWVGSSIGEATSWIEKSPLNPAHDYRAAVAATSSAVGSVTSGAKAVANKTMSILELVAVIVGGLVLLYVFSIFGGLKAALK